jgi:hypothetical protein
MVASKSAFVAFIFTAIATAWMVSTAASPTLWQPSTRAEIGLVAKHSIGEGVALAKRDPPHSAEQINGSCVAMVT